MNLIETPGDVEASIATLERGHGLPGRRSRSAERRTPQGDAFSPTGAEEWPAWRIFTAMIAHDRHHGAEIGVLRDLYRIAGAFRV